MVKRIAVRLLSRLPDSVELDDLVQAGLIALLETARHYQHDRGASFATFAGIRVRGAMLDEVRGSNWAPRSVYRKQRQISSAVQSVENRTGSHAQPRDIADEMGISLDDYFAMLATTSAARIFSLDQSDSDTESSIDRQVDGTANPLRDLEWAEFQRAMAEAIGGLPEREALVMALYYDEALGLKDIGRVLGVSESRVCQIHRKALAQLRARLQDWNLSEYRGEEHHIGGWGA
jgi:RNA polymerase sigma factor for flagellar operon FliA